MTSVQPYEPTYDFETDPDPQDKLNAAALQAQLNLIASNLSDLIAALAVSIRDDDTLSDDLVRLRNLHPELSTIVNQISDGLAPVSALAYLYPVDCASTANLTLSGEQTIDGVLTSASRVLVKDQTDPIENGIYTTDAGAWARTADLADGDSIVPYGVMVREGDTQAETAWALIAGSEGTEVIGTDEAVFAGPILQTVASPAQRYNVELTFDNGSLTQSVTHNLGDGAASAVLYAVDGSPVLAGVVATKVSANVMQFVFPTQPGEVTVGVSLVV